MVLKALWLVLLHITAVEGFTLPPAKAIPESSTTATVRSAVLKNQKHLSTISASKSSDVSAESPPSSTDSDGAAGTIAHYDFSDISTQLDDILLSKSSSLFDEINVIREKSDGSQEAVESYLNTILDVIGIDGSEKQLPWWTKIRFTARISRRARIASLRRVLDLSTPTVDETESLGDDVDAKKRRRRRALVVLLRSLAQTIEDDEEEGDKSTAVVSKNKKTTIYNIEKAAKRDLKKSLSSQDMKSRLPPGLETPKYEVFSKEPLQNGGYYEIRNYEAFSVCSVPMTKPRPDGENTDQKLRNPQLKGASSFGALAGYLFGKNKEEKAMKMTTPVFTQGDGEGKEMSFVLPSNYWGDDGIIKAPTPLENSLVKLKREEGGCRAAIMFGGFASARDVKAKKEELLSGLSSDKEWEAVGNDVTTGIYNDPFTPPWKRCNEVSIAVKRRNEQ